MQSEMCECENASHTYLSPVRSASAADHGARAVMPTGAERFAQSDVESPLMVCGPCRDAGHL